MPKPKIARSTIISLIILMVVIMIYIALVTEQPAIQTDENTIDPSALTS